MTWLWDRRPNSVLGSQLYWVAVGKTVFAFLGGLLGGIELIQMFEEDFAPEPAIVWALSILGILVALRKNWPSRISGPVGRDFPDSSIEIVQGDLLHRNPESSGIVVGISRRFETKPDLITRKSLQYKLQESLSDEWVNQRTERSEEWETDAANALKAEIDNILKAKGVDLSVGPSANGEVVSVNLSMKGSTEPSYEDERVAHFLAYTNLESEQRVNSFGREQEYPAISSTVDNIWTALSSLWEVLHNEYSMNETVDMPIIGTVSTGLGGVLTSEDSIKLIMLSYAFAVRKYRDEIPKIRIVVREDTYKKLDRMTLAAFRKSLERSS